MDTLGVRTGYERTLTFRARRNGGDFVEVAVSGNGEGIPTEKLVRLFEPFFSTKPQGMGLPISRTIIEAHGGRLKGEGRSLPSFWVPPICPPGGQRPDQRGCLRRVSSERAF